jgi:hypothetical protein
MFGLGKDKDEATQRCAQCKAPIPDETRGSTKHVNGKLYCTMGCAKKAADAEQK